MTVTVALTEEQGAAEAALLRRLLEHDCGHSVLDLDKVLAEESGR